MANEVKVTCSLECTNGNFKLPKHGGSTQQITQSGKGGGIPGMVTATNAAQGVNVTTTGIASLGVCYIRHTGASGDPDVTFGPVVAATLHEFGKLKAGEEYCFRLKPGITWAVKSAGADVEVQVVIVDD